MTKRAVNVLLVEDSPQDAQIFQAALTHQTDIPIALELADRLSAALQHLAQHDTDLVLLDLMLPDSEGFETVAKVHAQHPRIPIIVLTATDDEGLAVQSLQKGAQDYLVKGYVQVYPHLLRRAIRYAMERKRAEDEVRDAYAQTEQILSSITSILIGVDPAGLVTHWNQVAEATFGIPAETVLHAPLAACRVGWHTEAVLEAIAECRSKRIAVRVDDVPFKRPDGREGFVGLTVIPVTRQMEDGLHVLLYGADVTERKQAEVERLRLQEQLLQAQKMETIGRFAGGIAHDFNNFLQVILGFTWLIRARHRNDRELISDLQEIVHAAESASGMVRQLLTFSRRKALQLKIFELNQAVQNMARLLQQFVGESIRVDVQPTTEPLMVKMEPTALEQMLMNLCSNARDSMRQGGTLTIQTSMATTDAAFLDSHPDADAGAYARVSIRDTGTGMDPAVAARIFEPFFTTKQVGKGTGLGLAVVYGLIRQHEGFIDIETAQGRGTTFHLYFPYQTVKPEESTAAASGGRRGTEAILVVEHDDRQRALDEEVLRESGYEVAGACDEARALEFLTQHTNGVDAIILDASLPGLSGRELLERIRERHPNTRVLLVSGYVDEQLSALESTFPGVHILQRPYVPAHLLDQLRELLDESLTHPADAARSSQTRRRILVVDDDPSVRLLCERILQDAYEVTVVASGAEALERLRRAPHDLVLTDIVMPEMDGIALLEAVARLQPAPQAMAMTGSLSSEMEQRVLSVAPGSEIIRKPFTASMLLSAVSRRFVR